jgi:cell division protein FtsQ
MLYKTLKLAGYILLVAFLAITLAFTSKKVKHITCGSIEVEYSERESIRISKDEVLRIIMATDNHLIGKRMDQINTEIIEKEIEKHQAILNAEVYKMVASDSTSFKGVLGVRVKHREPVLRIMSSGGSYYMDETGEKIPVSTSYAAKVMVATGFFSEEFAKEELLPFVLFLEENPFWKAQITQIHVEQSGDLLLTPLVGNHQIELGSLDNFQDKLRNMKTFYEQILARNNWEKYEKISLKYKNQIVAKKR